MQFLLLLSALMAAAAAADDDDDTSESPYKDWNGDEIGPGKRCACMYADGGPFLSSDPPPPDPNGMERLGQPAFTATERCCIVTAGKDAWDKDAGSCDAKLVDYEGEYGDDFERCCVAKGAFNACHNQLRKGEKEYTDIKVEWEDGKRVFKDYSEEE